MHVCFVGFWTFLSSVFWGQSIVQHYFAATHVRQYPRSAPPGLLSLSPCGSEYWEYNMRMSIIKKICWATCCKCQWYWYALGLPSKACSKPSSQARCEDFNPAIPCLILSRFSPFRRRGCLFRPWRCRAVVPFHWLRIFPYWITVTPRASNSALLKPRNDSMTSKTIQRAQEIEAMPVIPVVFFSHCFRILDPVAYVSWPIIVSLLVPTLYCWSPPLLLGTPPPSLEILLVNVLLKSIHARFTPLHSPLRPWAPCFMCQIQQRTSDWGCFRPLILFPSPQPTES